VSDHEVFEETDITALLNHPYDDPTQAIICCFPTTNFAMTSVIDSWCSLVVRTCFIPTKVEKSKNPDYPYMVFLDYHFGIAAMTPYKSTWTDKKPEFMKVLKLKPINLKVGKLYDTHVSAMNRHSWPVWSNPCGHGYDNIFLCAELKQNDRVVLLELIPEHKKAKVLTPNGIVGWIPSVLLKDL
jgi:hypothetical protein